MEPSSSSSSSSPIVLPLAVVQGLLDQGVYAKTTCGKIAALGQFTLPEMGNPDWNEYSLLNEGELAVAAEHIKSAARCGWPINDAESRAYLHAVTRKRLKELEDTQGLPWIDKLKQDGGDVPEFGHSFMEK